MTWLQNSFLHKFFMCSGPFFDKKKPPDVCQKINHFSMMLDIQQWVQIIFHVAMLFFSTLVWWSPEFFKDVSFHVSCYVKFGHMGCCDFGINNPQNLCLVTFNMKYYILSQIFYRVGDVVQYSFSLTFAKQLRIQNNFKKF